eukprot:11637408-Heterocapsa_arctica.AAC.1
MVEGENWEPRYALQCSGKIVGHFGQAVPGLTKSHCCDPGLTGDSWADEGSLRLVHLGVPTEGGFQLARSKFCRKPCSCWISADPALEAQSLSL